MLVCYLDDSGKDPQNPITTLAGYIARDAAWAAFESEVEPWFDEFGVRVLHAKELADTDGSFRGWKILKKQTFVSRICSTMTPHVMMGMSMSAMKKTYQIHKTERQRPTVSPYGFCFNAINDWIFRDIRTGLASNTEGVAFILECGHENNQEVEDQFHAIKEQHPDIAPFMRSICFVPKEHCRAIQMADLLAFYSRRDGVAQLKAHQHGNASYEADTMIKIITENLPHRGFVATDFGPNSGSRFLAGNP